jgi:hypothetical protein
MKQRWSRLLRAFGEFRRLVEQRQLIPVGSQTSLTGCPDAALADCKNRLGKVLLPEAEHSLLANRLNNTHATSSGASSAPLTGRRPRRIASRRVWGA